LTSLSVVIPAYNEEEALQSVVSRVLATRPQLASVGVSDLEVIVVDDGSADGTSRIAGSLEGVRLVRHPKNRGYGAALKTGFRSAAGELIAFLDADGTYPPEYLPRLCQAAMNGSDLVIGSRMAGADSRMPVTRRLGNFFFAGLLSLVGRQKISDSASGMRVFSREILPRVYPLPDGLNLTPVMSTRAIHEGIPMKEVPIPYSERVGRSKLSAFRDGSIFLQSIIWTALTYNPVRILGFVGIFALAVAFSITLGLVAARLSGVTSLGPWGVGAVYLALVASVSGISLFSLGVTFNYLVSLFYRRPIRQGLFGRPLFKAPLEHQFGRLGAASLVGGGLLSLASFVLSLSGWDMARLWLYMVASALLVLTGVQLLIYAVLVRVLDELRLRDGLTSAELEGALLDSGTISH
jgi:glycosyltransferase involved in cell wall biosynthesis